MKKESGITIIALVITIVLMLILVAVTIKFAQDGGLFGMARDAANQTQTQMGTEQSWANNIIDQYVNQ